MRLLGIETSSSVGSVALAIDGHVAAREMATPREQTEQLLALVDALVRDAGISLRDLDAIVFGRGPGSFTGLRVAVAVVQGLAVVSGVPLVAVSSLRCIAQRAAREHGCERALVCVDAHMGEVYFGEFAIEAGLAVAAGAERLGGPADVSAPAEGSAWCAVGNGFASQAATLAPIASRAAAVWPELLPAAADLFPAAAVELAAGRTVAPEAALPVYLREHTAWRRQS
jgi:tRNA threonylcarbamoyladenosine biosynthesis protein TsaB